MSKVLSVFFVLFLFGIVGTNILFGEDSDYTIYSDIKKIPAKKAALVLGTAKYVRQVYNFILKEGMLGKR